MNDDDLGIVVLLLAVCGIFIFASMGQSHPIPPLQDQLIYTIRVPVRSAISP
jgi:hypothetical protein